MKLSALTAVCLGCMSVTHVLAQSLKSPAAESNMPPGIGVRLTIVGPVFVDSRGMTIYRGMPALRADSSVLCDGERHALQQRVAFSQEFVPYDVTVPDVATRRTCLEKRPPVLAPADAKPIGKWNIRMRDDGTRQWTYDGAPLHTSFKDKFPGDINGSSSLDDRYSVGFGDALYPMRLALAPLPGAPAGVSTRRTVLGLALATHAGNVLYFSDSDGSAAQSELWEPLTAATMANADQYPNWSLVTRKDGQRQWAYQGHPLFTYAHDAGDTFQSDASQSVFVDIFGDTYGSAQDGWQLALLRPGPRHPAEVTVKANQMSGEQGSGYFERIYADPNGMTLYVIYCLEDTKDRLDCDDVGDSERYWLNFCGGEERCARSWRPLSARVGAKSLDNIWSAIVINRAHPWRPVTRSDQGLTVWAYKGRPVFRYAEDLNSADSNGISIRSIPIEVRTIAAYGTEPMP